MGMQMDEQEQQVPEDQSRDPARERFYRGLAAIALRRATEQHDAQTTAEGDDAQETTVEECPG